MEAKTTAERSLHDRATAALDEQNVQVRERSCVCVCVGGGGDLRGIVQLRTARSTIAAGNAEIEVGLCVRYSLRVGADPST